MDPMGKALFITLEGGEGAGKSTLSRRLAEELRARGVATAEYVPCVHLQPYMRERYGFGEGMCPVAEGFSARTRALPFHTRIDPGDQEFVVETLAAALGT